MVKWLVVWMVVAGPVWAQAHQHGAAAPGVTPGAPGSMMEGMDKMTREMGAVPMTGDADRDFVAMMIPHHQGAIDMARYQLAHGKDPALLKLAREIIAAQDREIAGMRAWQGRNRAGR